MADITPNLRVALRNDSYVLHKILPNKVLLLLITGSAKPSMFVCKYKLLIKYANMMDFVEPITIVLSLYCVTMGTGRPFG